MSCAQYMEENSIRSVYLGEFEKKASAFPWNLKLRTFRLNIPAGTLAYYPTSDDTLEPAGVVQLNGKAMILPIADDGYTYDLKLKISDAQIFQMRFDSKEKRSLWKSKIECAIKVWEKFPEECTAEALKIKRKYNRYRTKETLHDPIV
eukprot:g2338.t1